VQSPELADVDARIAETQAALADADSSLQAAAPNYGQLVQQVVTAPTVQALLHPGEAFVAMTLNDTAGWLFLVRRDRLAVARIAGGLPAMAGLVGHIRASIEGDGTVPPEFDTDAAYRLYAATLAGVEADLDGITSLAIAPVGPLLAIPFDVLLTGPAKPDQLVTAPWLLRRFSLSHVPSPGNFVSLRRIAGGSRAARPWFGFGEFQPILPAQARHTFAGQDCAASAALLADLSPLPFATRELEAARLLLGADSSDELLGADFTAAAVLHRDLRNYRVLQFSTHALLPSELACQTEPAIVTSVPAGAPDASGALLTASQVANLNLDADLIILSACNSGGPGGTVAGESLSGLARSFFYAGARALMVTHWAVNDQTAAYLVADMLRRLREQPTAGIAEALRATELGMLDGAGKDLNPEVAHPFYWAPFAVIGEGSSRLTGLASK
jgi:CHAT domain-containing protein